MVMQCIVRIKSGRQVEHHLAAQGVSQEGCTDQTVDLQLEGQVVGEIGGRRWEAEAAL